MQACSTLRLLKVFPDDVVESVGMFFVTVAGVGDDFQLGLAVAGRDKMSGYASGLPNHRTRTGCDPSE